MSFRLRATLSAFVVALSAVAALSFSTPASAQSVEAAAKERHDLMESFGDSSKTLAAAAKGAALNADVAKAAEDIAAGMKKLPNLVPAGSGSDKLKNRAKPEIWTDMPKFVAYATDGEMAFTSVAAAAKAGDTGAFQSAFTKASAVCSACHKDFRGPAPR